MKVIVMGAGIVGIVMAALLRHLGIAVVLLEKNPLFVTEEEAITGRVVALNSATIRLLKEVGMWSENLAQSPFERLVVWQDTLGDGTEFSASSVATRELGYIVSIAKLLKEGHQRLMMDPGVKIRAGVEAVKLVIEEAGGTIFLADGSQESADLLIGADGAHSWIREAVGISLSQKSYHQQAIIAAVSTEKPHHRTGWQRFLSTGPLAFLPLADAHHCAIVWSLDQPESLRHQEMSDQEFDQALAQASQNQLGQCHLLSSRQSFPLSAQCAQKYVAGRVVLVGDAAHTIHPLAGQGLNLGLGDAQELAQLIQEAIQKHRLPFSDRVLGRYQVRRRISHQVLSAVMDAFYHSSQHVWSRNLRQLGFALLNRCDFLKEKLIQYADS